MSQSASASKDNYIATHLKESAPSDEEDCPICKDEWDAPIEEVISLHCGHVFHRKCILAWFKDGNTCPSCRAKCFPSEVPMLYISRDPNSLLFDQVRMVLIPFVLEARENITANPTDQLGHQEVFDLFLENSTSYFLGSQLGRDTLISDDALRAFLIHEFLSRLTHYQFTGVGARARALQTTHYAEAVRNSPRDIERYLLRAIPPPSIDYHYTL
ncbi:RING/U-box [Corynespora cassiicola Philippines]|uniref:RING/U-box n=1 Tax=Corynespora cassiicola Philippines TaxID=1448308 RepID=A0A2T2P8N8_CORCC|nr:RING/U-box [Corynespora cassiicola Philippines]